MKDPNLSLLNAFKTALSGMSFNGTSVPVYSKSAPLKNVPKKYVILGAQSKTENDTKCGTWFECTITTNIVTRYPNGEGDITFNMVVGEEISTRVQDDILVLDGFNIRQRKQLPTTDLVLETDTENVFQYLLIFYYKINRA